MYDSEKVNCTAVEKLPEAADLSQLQNPGLLFGITGNSERKKQRMVR